jgi:hypothetical protein
MRCDDVAIVLHDLQVPGSEAHIDHLIVVRAAACWIDGAFSLE